MAIGEWKKQVGQTGKLLPWKNPHHLENDFDTGEVESEEKIRTTTDHSLAIIQARRQWRTILSAKK